MNQLTDSQVMQRIKRELAQYIKENKPMINTHIIGNVKTEKGGNKKMKYTKKTSKKDSGNRGKGSYYTRICSTIINKTLKASKCKKDRINFCVDEKENKCCNWAQRYTKEWFKLDFAKSVWRSRHPGYKQKVKSEIECDDMLGMFRKENILNLIITDDKCVELEKFKILCRSFQVILTDITPGGNCMRVSYGKEPKIGSDKIDFMMVLKQNGSCIVPLNRMFIAGVGYAADLLPVICLHREFILNYNIHFFIPPHTDQSPIRVWLQVNDKTYPLSSSSDTITIAPARGMHPVSKRATNSTNTVSTASVKAPLVDTTRIPSSASIHTNYDSSDFDAHKYVNQDIVESKLNYEYHRSSMSEYTTHCVPNDIDTEVNYPGLMAITANNPTAISPIAYDDTENMVDNHQMVSFPPYINTNQRIIISCAPALSLADKNHAISYANDASCFHFLDPRMATAVTESETDHYPPIADDSESHMFAPLNGATTDRSIIETEAMYDDIPFALGSRRSPDPMYYLGSNQQMDDFIVGINEECSRYHEPPKKKRKLSINNNFH